MSLGGDWDRASDRHPPGHYSRLSKGAGNSSLQGLILCLHTWGKRGWEEKEETETHLEVVWATFPVPLLSSWALMEGDHHE